jgi:hypothetical protein
MTALQSFHNTTDIVISDRTKDRKESIVPQAQGVSVEQDIFFQGGETGCILVKGSVVD